MRHTGIAILGDAPWGTHFCPFYDSKQDLIDILVPYFKAGLENNEFCMWVTSEPLSAEEAKAALAREIVNLGDYLRQGQIEFLDYSQWYTLGGKFEADRVLQGWVDRLAAARERGFDGLRLTGNTFWLEKPDWQDFTEYEATLDRVIGEYPMLVMCTYSLAKCGAAEIMDVVSNHAVAMIKRRGEWQIIENAERKRMGASLLESKEQLRHLNSELEDRVTQDIAARERDAARLHQLNRTLKAHNRSNQALVLATDEAAYLREVCKIIVEDCGHAMVWVGFREEDEAKTVRPVAYSGFEEGYLDTLRITWADTERGRGPGGTAIRTGQVCTCRNMLSDPSFLPWREEAIRRGYASSIVLPLLAGDKAFGALTIYSTEPDPFSENETKLLTGLAGDFAYGINVLRLRAAHALAEQTLHESEERYRSLVEMSPDAVFVSHDNRLVQVNGAALRLLGAESPGQVLGKSPFEIFHPDYHALVRERIQQVLAGQSVPLIEEKVVRLDGATCDVEVAASRCREKQGFAVQVILRDITERKATEEALRQHREWLRVTLTSIGDAVLATDTSGRITFLNPVAAQLTGWAEEQALGQPARDIFRVLNEQTRKKAEDIIGRVLRQGRGLSLAVHTALVTRDGREIPIEESAAPILGSGGNVLGVVLVFHDVTEKRRAEEALRESEERYHSLFRNMAEGFALHEIITNPDGTPCDYRFLDVNPGFERMTGLKAAGVIGRTVREALPGIEPHWIERYGQVALSGEPATFESHAAALDRWYEVLAYRPSPRRFAAIFLDVTGRKRAEERLREAQKLESIGLLAGGIAHDFNNLLVGVVGNASLAQGMVAPGSHVAGLLDQILKTGEQLAHLTRQMLAYSGKGRFFLEHLNLSDLIPEMCALVQPSIPKKIELRLELERGLPPVEADRGQMQQVFMNLVLNAAEAIGADAGLITVKTGLEQVDGRHTADLPPGAYVCLEVHDTGCGMDEAAKARIFDPFYSTKFVGRGLGLAAVSGIVRGHKGAITVTSAPGHGSCFTILLPVAENAVAISPAAALKADLFGSGTILVVDDEEVVREIAKSALERHGYHVLVADSGLAAIDVVKRHPGDIKLVILDLSMPGMGGEEALPELRKIRPKVNVVASSGYSEAEMMRRLAGQPVSGFLQKPFTSTRLAEQVKRALR